MKLSKAQIKFLEQIKTARVMNFEEYGKTTWHMMKTVTEVNGTLVPTRWQGVALKKTIEVLEREGFITVERVNYVIEWDESERDLRRWKILSARFEPADIETKEFKRHGSYLIRLTGKGE